MPHLLKSLELNGFKSFAQKVVLDFPAGITAIVGPNGSGKSNVVDAIRWLLGERESKNLRGSKVEDLIFAGTPERPRMGLAEASLHFENQNDFFPLEASEISVMRQVTRDGSSQYFINKSEIRLKDLIDFFARAKLGTKGLTVVSQGNSDIFIRSTPRERREMVEETLGLREFQIKKTRAENQLKNTQINLDKVQALIEEILPHLRSLKRQTGRWEKRSILESELSEIENLFFGSQLNWLKIKMAEIEQAIHNHGLEFRTLESEKIKLEKEQAGIEASEPREREELKKIKIQVEKLLEIQIKLEKDLSRLEAQIEITSRKPEISIPNSSVLYSLIKKIRQNLHLIHKGELEDIKSIIQNLIHEIDSYFSTPESSNQDSSIFEFKTEFKKIESELDKIKDEIKILKNQESSLQKSQGDFYESFKQAVTAVEMVKGKIEEWDIRNQKLKFEKERLGLRLEELKRQADQAGHSLRDFEQASSGVILRNGLESNEIREWESKIFKLRGDLAAIGDIDQAVVKEAEETEVRYEFLKKELDDIQKAQVDLRHLIAELTHKIKSEFDAAIHEINKEFNNFFKLMFDGGHAKLKLEKPSTPKEVAPKTDSGNEENLVEDVKIEENNKEEMGLEIELSLPRKRISSLEVLSGGERSLVGIAALFSMISVSPPPFLVLDEVDAPLDERNARRFANMLKNFSTKTQFIIVTHNRASMEAADVLYGVTLNSDGTSKIVSLKLEPSS